MQLLAEKLSWAMVALLAASSLAQAEENSIGRIIVFGDSLSDGGFFSVGSPLPPGQSFTTNPDPVAPEVFAAQLGLEVQPAYGQGGTNFAVGGARVTAGNPPSISIVNQIDNFTAAAGQFREDDVVYIQGGGNDYFAFLAAGGDDPGILSRAATDLAGQVRRLQDAGAHQIVTMAVQSGGAAAVQAFNETYEAELAAEGINALYFDTDALFTEMVQMAGDFGFTNVSDPACGELGALYCVPPNFVTPDANETYILADGVHPAGKAQRVQGQAIASLLLAPEQIGQLAYATQSLLRAHRVIHQRPLYDRSMEGAEDTAAFANLQVHNFKRDATPQSTGIDEQHLILGLGAEHRVTDRTRVGTALGISNGDGDFGLNRGDFQVDALSGLLYMHTRVGALRFDADLIVGQSQYDALTREVRLGPVTRRHEGNTETEFRGIGAAISYVMDLQPGLQFTPRIGLDHQTLSIDAYSEGEDQSTSASFEKQELDSLNVALGFSLIYTPFEALILYLNAQLNSELEDDVRQISMTPSGAAIAFTSHLSTADDRYLDAQVGAAFRPSGGLQISTGVTTTRGRDDLESTAFFIGASLDL